MLVDSAFYKYHHSTKHTVEKLNANRHFLDWANQPNPFRFYAGAPEIELPRELVVSKTSFFESMNNMSSGEFPEPHKVDATFISNLLFYSMAISAWKQIRGTEHRWALRVNPSSGNLHPTDTHLFLNGVHGLPDGVYHYYVPRHSLEQRSNVNLGTRIWQALRGQRSPQIVICLTSIFWRESWKYQSRAFRYCQHDLGHALASIMLSASVLGFRVETVAEFPDQQVIDCLGLNGNDEKPFLVLGLFPGSKKSDGEKIAHDFSFGKEVVFHGVPNELSPEEIKYHAIDDVYKSTIIDFETWKRRAQQKLPKVASGAPFAGVSDAIRSAEASEESNLSVHRVIRSRRSAVDLDGQRQMTLAHFLEILKTATKGFSADFQGQGEDAFYLIDLYLYVHRVDGLKPGIYYWDRQREELLPVASSDQRAMAKFVSCFQDIAADGCFAVSMIANFSLGYELFGDRCYRYVHYEAGLIGQWLYLGATALNYQATGIGCFLDDEVNRYLPLPDGQEVVYNFTVGEAVLDPRLTTLSAYDFHDPTST